VWQKNDEEHEEGAIARIGGADEARAEIDLEALSRDDWWKRPPEEVLTTAIARYRSVF
jgi:hypothetical protein